VLPVGTFTNDVRVREMPTGVYPRPSPEARFRAKTRPDQLGCLVWRGALVKGYGYIEVGGRLIRAARFAWQQRYGPIPDGMEIDHLCRNPACVKVTHLEAVTHRQNVLRGNHPNVLASLRDRCSYGHPYDEKNTYWRQSGHRECRLCHARQEGERRRHNRKEVM